MHPTDHSALGQHSEYNHPIVRVCVTLWSYPICYQHNHEYKGVQMYKTLTKKVKYKVKWKKVKKKVKWKRVKIKKGKRKGKYKWKYKKKKVWKYKTKYKTVKYKVKDYKARDVYVYDLGVI